MKYIDEFRDQTLARALSERIRRTVRSDRTYRLMEFCGGHTHAIHRYGIPDLLPDNIELIHGPGCPVCVLPVGRIEAAIQLALERQVVLCTYADLMRVPAKGGRSLFSARAQGADVRMVYSPLQALEMAVNAPEKEVVFLAIGFETTTPPTAATVLRAHQAKVVNFSVFCNHVLTPAAISALLADPEEAVRLDGIIGPAHVSTVIGSDPYDRVAREFKKPIVIAGFEPLDILQSIAMLVEGINEGKASVENEYVRSVKRSGNQKALGMIEEVFEVRDTFSWRGLGAIPRSGLRIRDPYSAYDAELKYELVVPELPEPPGCACGQILKGRQSPAECALFGTRCTPETPVGACMVSSEGACAAWYAYGGMRQRGT